MDSSRRSIFRYLVLCCVLFGLGCGEPNNEDAASRLAAREFPAFASQLFAQLESQPPDANTPVQLGLFGDLDLMSGESVVMGRYRYRVDSLDGTRRAHMAFQMRTEPEANAAPIVLTFVSRDGRWNLEQAEHLPHGESELDSVLARRLSPWAESAVERVSR